LQLKLFTLDLHDGRLTEMLGDRWYIAAASWSACGRKIVFAGDHGSELTVPVLRLWVMDCNTSKPECRTGDLSANIGLHLHHDMPTWATSQNNIFVVRDSSHAYATATVGGRAQILRIALEGPIKCEEILSGDRACIILDVRAKTSQLVFASSGMSAPWELNITGLQGSNETQLTRLNESVLAAWPALRARHLTFSSPDGLELEGWFLSRADREGPQPVVLFIHGGPELAVGHIFRFDLQLLAANGYAVLFANFRGSSGYGEDFRKGLQGSWGERGFPDHMAAVDSAIAGGLADPGRLGVWGPSFGGFSTCWIVGHTHRFRAAVAESAVTNLSTLYYTCDVPDIFSREFGGRPDQVPEIYRARSPLTYAAACRTPTLMLHGEGDLRCSIIEAEQFYRALLDVGCPTELVRVPGMAHMGDSTGPLPVRLAQNEALLEWFERHL
jgi:dipeptidyl aminopeptidase/acylaminoacyl peptidase